MARRKWNGDQWFTVAILVAAGLFFLYHGVRRPSTLMTSLGAGLLISCAMLRVWPGVGRWMAAGVVLSMTGVIAWSMVRKGLTLNGALGLFATLWGAWTVWVRFRPEPKLNPLYSLVLLLERTRTLTAKTVADIAGSAWGGRYHVYVHRKQIGSSSLDRWVVGESAAFLVRSPEALFVVQSIPGPYFDDVPRAAAESQELRIRKAIRDHRAWLSVDLVQSVDEAADPKTFYPQIACLLASLAGPDALALYHPDTGKIHAWDPALAEKLRGSDPLGQGFQPEQAPVIEVSSDDPRMRASVEEARRRWPEFVAAFQSRAGEMFSVKVPIAVGERKEFIWIRVKELEPETVRGELDNKPVDLPGLDEGSPVEVSVAEVQDWGWFRNGERVGFFSVAVLLEIRKQARQK